ncbi:hypothetical protein RY27_27000 [Litorilinea aerophila]|nr:hypothetical protein RY27_27000 [Litorilinea aerophila]
MLHVGRYMFMVRMGTLKRRFVRMWLRIIPVELGIPMPDFISVPVNFCRQSVKYDTFTHHNSIATGKIKFAGDPGECMPSSYKSEG